MYVAFGTTSGLKFMTGLKCTGTLCHTGHGTEVYRENPAETLNELRDETRSMQPPPKFACLDLVRYMIFSRSSRSNFLLLNLAEQDESVCINVSHNLIGFNVIYNTALKYSAIN